MMRDMKQARTTVEELAFKTAELDRALKEAGFELALADPAASRDFSYRARYLRRKSTLFPRLQANLEYYLATKSFSLRISADEPAADPLKMASYYCLVKNYRGSLKELLDRYFDSMRRGVPLMLGDTKK
jgi:hypothetical protein